MADTGEDLEIKQRVSAHRAETVRESNQLEQRIKQAEFKRNAKRNKPGRSPNTKLISGKQADPAAD
jgi:hypothetical protein